MSTALGIAPDASGEGTDPLTLRRIISARWARPGVVTGLTCSGRTDLRYQVAAGVAVCRRSATDGCTEAYWQGGTTSAVLAGDPSNPRVDVVYVIAHDPTQGDPDNKVSVGVAQGTPSTSPAKPAVPAGAVAVAVMRMPAGATSTSSAQPVASYVEAVPYMSELVQRDGTHIWFGSEVFNGSANGSGYVYIDYVSRCPGLSSNPVAIVQNGDWDAKQFTVSGTTVQNRVIVVFGVPNTGIYRLNWAIIGKFDPTLV